MTTGLIAVPGGELAYEDSLVGDETVVLLHGGMLSMAMWDAQFHALSAHYRVIRFDFRSHGASSTATARYSNHADLGALLEARGVEPAHLVGLSLGARTAIDFALSRPESVASLALCSLGISGMTMEDPFVLQQMECRQAAIAARDAEAYVECFLRAWVDGPQRLPGEVDPAVREACRAMARESVRRHAGTTVAASELNAVNRVPELRGPILLMLGSLDSTDCLGVGDLIAAHAANARRVQFAGAGHMLPLERPEEFTRHLREFLLTVHGLGPSSV